MTPSPLIVFDVEVIMTPVNVEVAHPVSMSLRLSVSCGAARETVTVSIASTSPCRSASTRVIEMEDPGMKYLGLTVSSAELHMRSLTMVVASGIASE